MKKSFIVILFALAGFAYTGCIKSSTVTTPTPYMNVTVDSFYIFNTTTVYPATLKLNNNDTTVELSIIASRLPTDEKVVLTIKNYKGLAGSYSIAAGQAGAVYYHVVSATGLLTTSAAIGGAVNITKMTDDSMIGYFYFQTGDTYIFTSGTFDCPKPYYVAHP